ncbi:hypothetical protein GWK48_07100 [Metallosphaera tengchongensis]|uniref:Uncharacterized protein n=1 Tax=Metallosphaera tengchongensis TaxID=1532350 RepID=A0A6N0NYJ3_9CREN|nr:hypothetical protein [Metallosphaera tengchongensis]QKR00170.1 hypothetical protein GWK48_07100 [Metallosphaera tengchongensis]
MNRRVLIIGVIVLVLGLIVAVAGFFVAKSGLAISTQILSPQGEKQFPLKPGINVLSIAYNSSTPPKVTVTGAKVVQESSSKGSMALVVNGTSPSVTVINNSTYPESIAVGTVSGTGTVAFGGLAFLLGIILFFVGLGIAIYGLVRK